MNIFGRGLTIIVVVLGLVRFVHEILTNQNYQVPFVIRGLGSLVLIAPAAIVLLVVAAARQEGRIREMEEKKEALSQSKEASVLQQLS